MKIDVGLQERGIAAWLDDPSLDLFITVTLKQALPNAAGGLHYMTREDAVRTAWVLRDRFSKACVGSSRYRAGVRLKWLSFLEGDGRSKRYHLHIVSEMKFGWTLRDYTERLQNVVQRLEWVHEKVDVRFIDYPTGSGSLSTIRYSLKEGSEAFLPEASHLTS